MIRYKLMVDLCQHLWSYIKRHYLGYVWKESHVLFWIKRRTICIKNSFKMYIDMIGVSSGMSKNSIVLEWANNPIFLNIYPCGIFCSNTDEQLNAYITKWQVVRSVLWWFKRIYILTQHTCRGYAINIFIHPS